MRIVRLVRAIFDIKLRDLSRRSGVSVRELARIEKGEVQAAHSTADALDRSVHDIIDERAARARETT